MCHFLLRSSLGKFIIIVVGIIVVTAYFFTYLPLLEPSSITTLYLYNDNTKKSPQPVIEEEEEEQDKTVWESQLVGNIVTLDDVDDDNASTDSYGIVKNNEHNNETLPDPVIGGNDDDDDDGDDAMETPDESEISISSVSNHSMDENEEDGDTTTTTTTDPTSTSSSSSPLLRAANLGTGYNPKPHDTPVKVVLWGKYWLKEESVLRLSGCPNSDRRGQCPYHPKCKIFYSTQQSDLKSANVVVIVSKTGAPDAASWLFARPKDNPIRVVYRREAFWGLPWTKPIMRSRYSLDMSFRPDSGIGNPVFLITPDRLFKLWGVEDEPRPRPKFAMSLISDCPTLSHRELYVKRLATFLGPARYHRYGACGDGIHILPKHDFTGVDQYKFLFEFENTVMPYYTTEKLFWALSLGPIPVYMGDPFVLNITTTRSFINARDFATPEELAKYLLYLAKTPSEYQKYHEWRKSPAGSGLSPQYLKLVARQVPGPEEVKVHAGVTTAWPNRRALCCRLCNLDFLKARMQVTDVGEMSGHMLWPDLDMTFYNGTMGQR